MGGMPIRSEGNELLEFIEQTLPLVKGGSLNTTAITEESVKKMAVYISEHSNFLRERPFAFEDVPVVVSRAFRGDHDSIYELSILTCDLISGAVTSNAIANLAVILGGNLHNGIKELNDVFGTILFDPFDRMRWRWSFYYAIFYMLELNLKPRIYQYFKMMAERPNYHFINILNSILLDSVIVHATRSQPLDLKILYKLLVEKELYKRRQLISEDLTEVAAPFLTHIFPFVSIDRSEGRTKLSIRGVTEEDTERLAEAFGFVFNLSVVYAAWLLSGIHVWRLFKFVGSEVELDEVFERAKNADYDPFLPPEAMIRHSFFVADSMLFKLTNVYLKMAGRSDLVFEPTGDLEKDIEKMWELARKTHR